MPLLQGTVGARKGSSRGVGVVLESRQDSEKESKKEKEQQIKERDRSIVFQTTDSRLSGYSSFVARIRYLKRHLLRTRANSLLLVGIGIGMVFLFGWMR